MKVTKRKTMKFADIQVGEYYEDIDGEIWQKVAFCGKTNASVLLRNGEDSHEVKFKNGNGMAVNRVGTLVIRGENFPCRKILYGKQELT